jgi:hypothetical protein
VEVRRLALEFLTFELFGFRDFELLSAASQGEVAEERCNLIAKI